MGWFGVLLFVVILPTAFLITFVFVVVRRGFQMNRLLADGVETTGTIIGRQSHHRKSIKTYHLRYRYEDEQGVSHTRSSMVEGSVYRTHEKDGVIPVVYSRSRPSVAAPKYLLEQVREGKEKQRVRKSRAVR